MASFQENQRIVILSKFLYIMFILLTLQILISSSSHISLSLSPLFLNKVTSLRVHTFDAIVDSSSYQFRSSSYTILAIFLSYFPLIPKVNT